MHCKICSTELIGLGVDPFTNFTCPTNDEEKTHSYFFHSDNEYGYVEDFCVTDKETGRKYVAWIQHSVKQTQLRVISGTKIVVSRLLNTDLIIDSITEEEFIDKVKRLMVLI